MFSKVLIARTIQHLQFLVWKAYSNQESTRRWNGRRRDGSGAAIVRRSRSRRSSTFGRWRWGKFGGWRLQQCMYFDWQTSAFFFLLLFLPYSVLCWLILSHTGRLLHCLFFCIYYLILYVLIATCVCVFLDRQTSALYYLDCCCLILFFTSRLLHLFLYIIIFFCLDWYWLTLIVADRWLLLPDSNFIGHSALRTMWLSAPVLAYVPVDFWYWGMRRPNRLMHAWASGIAVNDWYVGIVVLVAVDRYGCF